MVSRYGEEGAKRVKLLFDAGYRIEHVTFGGVGSYTVSAPAIKIYDGTTFGNRSMYDAATALFIALDSCKDDMEAAAKNRAVDAMKPADVATATVLRVSQDKLISATDSSGRVMVCYIRTHTFSAPGDAPRWLGELITVDGPRYVQRGDKVVLFSKVEERAGFGTIFDNSGTTNNYRDRFFAGNVVDLAKLIAELRLREVGVDRLIAEVKSPPPSMANGC